MVHLKELPFDDYHRVVLATCDKSDLRAVIAVHNINLGPALGGCRVLEYDSINEQLTDALKLSKGMTYKSALAGNKLGGGKATIQGPLTREKTVAFGKAMQMFNKDEPLYYTAADVGTNNQILAEVAQETDFVNYKGQDCSIATAHGVFYALRGALRYKGMFLDQIWCSILGYGKVGKRLSDIIQNNEGMVIASDKYEIFPKTQYGVMPDLIPNQLGYTDYRIAHAKGDVFMPCALGGVLNQKNIDEMKPGHVVCGAANNQLASQDMENELIKKGITYVPDYLANAGGVIITAEQNGAYTDLDWSDPTVLPRLQAIEETTLTVLHRAEKERVSASLIADKMAEEAFNG